MSADPDPWWAADHLSSADFDDALPAGSVEDDMRPSRREAEEELRQQRILWAAAERRAGWSS